MKYWLHCSALLLVLLCPAIVVVMQHSGKSLLTVSLLQEYLPTANNAISLPVELPVELSDEPQPTEPPDDFAPTSVLPADAPAPPVADFPEDSLEIHAEFDRAIVESNEETNTFILPEQEKSLAAEPAATSIASTLRIIMRPLLLVWLSGATLLITRLAFGWCRLAAILRTARPNTDSSLTQLFAQVGQQLHLARMPELVLSDRITAPIAAGLFRPRVILPTQLIDQVTPERLRDILVHEVAHIKRHDQQVVLLQNLSAAIFWIHPLVKLLNRHLAQAREEVCDNYVLTLTDAPSYGRTLLMVAELVQTTHPLPGTVGLFTSRWKLEDRVAGLLDERRSRTVGVTGRGRVLVVGLLLMMTTIVALGTIGLAEGPADKTANVDSRTSTIEKSANSESMRRIKGRVVDHQGGPIANADVWLPVQFHYCKDVAHARSNNEGLFTLDVPESWLPWMAWGYKDGYSIDMALPQQTPNADAGDYRLELKLGPATDVSFTVLDPDGKPMADALLQPYAILSSVGDRMVPDELLPLLSAKSDKTGRALLPGIPRKGLLVIDVITEQFGTQQQQRYHMANAAVERKIRLRPDGDIIHAFRLAPKHPPVLKRVLDVWRQRERTVESFQAKWSTKELLNGDRLPDILRYFRPYGGSSRQPRGDHRYEGKYAFAIDRANRVRNESKREQWSGKLAAFVPIKSVRVFNNKQLTKFLPTGPSGSGQPFPSAEIRQDSFRNFTSSSQSIPLRLIFRPFDDKIGYFDDPKMSLKSGTQTINGIECLKITSGRESLGEYQVVWVENNATYLPVKYTRASNGSPSWVVEIAYKNHEKYGRVPVSWKLERLFSQKEPYLTQSATVTSIQINEPIKEETFTVKFPVGTRVSNSVTNERYIQLKDGKKQPIVEDEVTGDAPKQPAAATQPKLPDIEFKGLQDPARVVAKLTGRDWGTVTLNNAPWIRELRHASSIRALRIIGKLDSNYLPRLDLEQVKGLIDLRISIPLDVNDLEAIGRLTQLERLSLPRKLALTVTGARQIARLTKLKSLVLIDVDVDDASFAELATLVNLERLYLTNARITDEGLKTLVHMPKLKLLHLYRHPHPLISQQISDACLPTVCGLTQLETLSISGGITDEGLTKIATLPRLKDLSISGTKVTGHGLAALKNSTIERLTIKGDLLGSAPSSPETGDNILTMMPGLANLGQCKHLKNVHVNGKNPPRWAWNRLAPDIEWRY